MRAEIIILMDSARENKLVIIATLRCIPMFFFFVITVSSCAIQKPNPAHNHYLGSLREDSAFLNWFLKSWPLF